jgi:hypothetical protein
MARRDVLCAVCEEEPRQVRRGGERGEAGIRRRMRKRYAGSTSAGAGSEVMRDRVNACSHDGSGSRERLTN